MRFFWILVVLFSVCVRIQAQNLIGSGGSVVFHAPEIADWSCDIGYFDGPAKLQNVRAQSVIWHGAVISGNATVTQRLAGNAVLHRVEITPARLEVKRQNSKTPWRTMTTVVAGAAPTDEHFARYRVIFPRQKNPLRALPVGRVVFVSGRKGVMKTAQIFSDSPTTGRILSNDVVYQRLKIVLENTENQVAAIVRQTGEQGSQFSFPDAFQFHRPVKLQVDAKFLDFEGPGMPKYEPIRSQKVGFEFTSIAVLQWDKARRDFVTVRIFPSDKRWKSVASRVSFAPKIAVSPTGHYVSRQTVRYDAANLIDSVNSGIVFYSQTLNGSKDWEPPDAPAFSERLKAPALAPQFPVFDAKTVEKMLRDVEIGANAPLLRAGVFGGHFAAALPVESALQLVKRELVAARPDTARWLQMQRLRAWGETHRAGGKSAALAVYAGILGRSKTLIQNGQSRLLRSVFEDWQDGVTGPTLNSQAAPTAEQTDAAVAAFETFLRLKLCRETVFDGNDARALYSSTTFGSVVKKLEKDASVPKDFYFRLAAGEVLASASENALAIKQLELARKIAPSNDQAALKSLYSWLDYALSNQSSVSFDRTPKSVDEAQWKLILDKDARQPRQLNSQPDPVLLSDEDKTKYQKIIDDWNAKVHAEQQKRLDYRANILRERIAKTGQGYAALYHLVTPNFEVNTPQSLAILAEMPTRASDEDVLQVGNSLIFSSYYQPDFDLTHFPPPPNVSQSPTFEEQRAQNQQFRALDVARNEQGRALLEAYLNAPRSHTVKCELEARLSLARFEKRRNRLEKARFWLQKAAPNGKNFADYRAAQKFLAR